MRDVDVDVAVLGGGLAGLSLAERLGAPARAGPSVVVVEQRAAYRDDRTWCAWRVASHRYDALVDRTWSRFEVREGGVAVVVECPDAPYQMISAGTFYRHAQSQLERSARVRLELGQAVVGAPRRLDDGWQIQLADGRAL